MSNIQYEQPLINEFVSALQRAQDPRLSISEVHNQICHCREYADVEFTATSGARWAIEAKYGAPANISNEVHKLFGDLLRETGRENRQNCKIGLLLHQRTERFFRCGVSRINRQKFIAFGRLIPVRSVFVLSPLRVICKTWEQFYDGHAGTPVR